MTYEERQAAEVARQAALAARPVDADGNPLCKCGKRVAYAGYLLCEEHEAIAAERTLFRNNRTGLLRSLPAWDWVEDDDQFRAKVKSPKLRALADRYTLDAGSLLVLGRTGAGKTASVNRALRRLIKTAPDRASLPWFSWTTAAEIMSARLTHRFGESEPELIRDSRKRAVLVIDEFGFERADPAFWVDIVDQRYTAGRVTITTSGATLDQLHERYGVATIRKLVEPRGAIVEG